MDTWVGGCPWRCVKVVRRQNGYKRLDLLPPCRRMGKREHPSSSFIFYSLNALGDFPSIGVLSVDHNPALHTKIRAKREGKKKLELYFPGGREFSLFSLVLSEDGGGTLFVKKKGTVCFPEM